MEAATLKLKRDLEGQILRLRCVTGDTRLSKSIRSWTVKNVDWKKYWFIQNVVLAEFNEYRGLPEGQINCGLNSLWKLKCLNESYCIYHEKIRLTGKGNSAWDRGRQQGKRKPQLKMDWLGKGSIGFYCRTLLMSLNYGVFPVWCSEEEQRLR